MRVRNFKALFYPVDILKCNFRCESLGGNYYRLNPLVEEEIGLDETSDEKLLSLLWDTQVYLQENKAMVKEIAHMLSGTN